MSQRLRRIVSCSIVVAATMACPAARAQAGNPDADEVASLQAAFILNFARYAEWPRSSFRSGRSPITIAVAGDDRLATFLEEQAAGQSLGGRRIVVTRLDLSSLAGLGGGDDGDAARAELAEQVCRAQLVFIGREASDNMSWLLERLAGEDVLTVSDIDGFAARGGMIGLVVHDRRVAFEANLDEIDSTRMSIRSQVLRLARAVASRSSDVTRLVRSFGTRLVLLVTASSGAAAVLVCLVLVGLNYRWMLDEAIRQLEAQGAVIGTWSAAALVFEDADAGRETLNALGAVPGVVAATIFDGDGNIFADYREQAVSGHLPAFALGPAGQRRLDGWLLLVTDIRQQDRVIGKLQMVYDMGAINARLRRNVIYSLGASLLATSVAMLIALRLQQVLARPVRELVDTTRRVSADKGYDARARKLSDDELGQLTDAFNEMLDRIQEQNAERKRAEQERLRLLESEREARGEAERASRMKDEFLATLSHELRTPLSAVLGWAQVLRRGALDADGVAEGLEVIERNARAQAQIIEDLLDMSRIISGRLRLDVQHVRLVDVIEEALATVQPAAEGKAIRLETVLDPHAGPVRGDPARLQQVVWNPLSNAIKFTPRGGSVQVALECVDSHVEISINDTGQGIEAEFLPQVFERFRQADQSTTRRHGGLGLGLALVKQFVELHGGSVQVRSAGLGQGSTFTVQLPLAAKSRRRAGDTHPRTARPVAVGDSAISLDGVRVLVVDDEPDARELIRRLLEDSAAVVTTTGSAGEALDALDHFEPDVIVSDIGMPGRDGYDLIQEVRARGRGRGGAVPAIALTAFARSEDRTRALVAGYQMHVAKPVEPSELIASVASLAGVMSDPGATMDGPAAR